MAAAGVGVKYVLAAEGVTDLGEATPQLFATFSLPFQGSSSGWISTAAKSSRRSGTSRAQGADFLPSSVTDDDPVKPLAALVDGRGRGCERAHRRRDCGDLRLAGGDAPRAATHGTDRHTVPPSWADAGRMSPARPRRDSAFEYFWRSRDQASMSRIEAATKRVPNRRQPIAVLVHGHTHLPDRASHQMQAQIERRRGTRWRQHIPAIYIENVGIDLYFGMAMRQLARTRQCVVARLPSRTPAAARTNAPVQIDATRTSRERAANGEPYAVGNRHIESVDSWYDHDIRCADDSRHGT